VFLIPALHFSRSRLPPAPLQAHSHGIAQHLLSPISGLDGGTPSMIPAAQAPLGDFGFPFRTKSRRRWHQARSSGSCSVSSAPSGIAFQRVKGDRRTFSARAPLLVFQRRRLLLKLSCIFRVFTRAIRATRITHCLQVSQTLLAEPYKYSKCLHTSSMAVGCIRWNGVKFSKKMWARASHSCGTVTNDAASAGRFQICGIILNALL
jgi:hypothetical protein